MPSLSTLSIPFFAVFAAVHAASMVVEETSSTVGQTGCLPSCQVTVSASLGSITKAVGWTGDCVQNYHEPSGTQDVDDDHQMTWLRQEDGQTVIDVYRNSDKKYDRWAITNCEGSTPLPGAQCGIAGGGCDATQILFEAQGS